MVHQTCLGATTESFMSKLLRGAAARKSPVRVYCEHGALATEIKKWAREGRIQLVHFPYDPNSHTRRIPGIAEPSGAQIRDLNLPINDLRGVISDYNGSEHLHEILAIVGHENRRDALHVDSAFKSRCVIFITTDSHILQHKAQLQALLGFSFLTRVLSSRIWSAFLLTNPTSFPDRPRTLR